MVPGMRQIEDGPYSTHYGDLGLHCEEAPPPTKVVRNYPEAAFTINNRGVAQAPCVRPSKYDTGSRTTSPTSECG